MAVVSVFSSRFKWFKVFLTVFYLIYVYDRASFSSSAGCGSGFNEFHMNYTTNWIVNSSLWNIRPSTCWLRPPGSAPFRPRHRQSGSIVFVALLLLSGDIEANPGPGHITIGSLNACSAGRKRCRGL